MLLTKASEYALLSIALIAKSDDPKDAETLSVRLGIPKSFLAKILQSLARADILVSFKGARGGFALAKKPHEISILDVVHAVEVKSAHVFECSGALEDCPSGEAKASVCTIWPYLHKLQIQIDDFLGEITLEEMLKQ